MKHGIMSWMRTMASSPSPLTCKTVSYLFRYKAASSHDDASLPPPSFNALDLLSNPFRGMMAFHSAVGGEPFDSVQYPKVAVLSSDLLGDDGGLCLERGPPGLPLTQVS